MNFYEELKKIVETAKADGSRSGRAVNEGQSFKPGDKKLKNYIYQLATDFANKFYELIGTDYRALQQKESDIALAKSELNHRTKEFCIAKEEKKAEQAFLVSRIEDVKQRKSALKAKILQDEKTKQELEEYYQKPETEGDLTHYPMWFFIAVMSIVGFAELFIYKSVFLSQEIGIYSEMEDSEKMFVQVMAVVMGLGFIVMITWIAHEIGKRIRFIEGTGNGNRSKQWRMVIILLLIASFAIFSTVKMRSDMHKSSELDAKITKIIDAEDDDDEMFLDDDEDMDDDEDSDMDDEDSDEGMDEEDEESAPKLTELEKLESQIIAIKANGSWYFLAINFFIFIGGVMLAYHTHTSSVRYETLIAFIAKQRKELEELEQKKLKMLSHLKNDELANTYVSLPWYKQLFSKKEESSEGIREQSKVDACEKDFTAALKVYLELVNDYDSQREEIHSKADATVSAYINGVRSYIDALTSYVDAEFDEALYTDEELERIINERTKLEKYHNLRQDNAAEILSIENIDTFIAEHTCSNKELDSYFNAFRAVEIPKKEEEA